MLVKGARLVFSSNLMLETISPARRHQAITWTNIDEASAMLFGIHFRIISQEMLKRHALDISLKMTAMILQSYEEYEWREYASPCLNLLMRPKTFVVLLW